MVHEQSGIGPDDDMVVTGEHAAVGPESQDEHGEEHQEEQRNDISERIAEITAKLLGRMREMWKHKGSVVRRLGPLPFILKGAEAAVEHTNAELRPILVEINENKSWLSQFMDSFEPAKVKADFEERKNALLESLRTRIADTLDLFARRQEEIDEKIDRLRPKLADALEELRTHVIRMAGDADAVIVQYTGDSFRFVTNIERGLMVVIAGLEIAAGFVPTQYHTNSIAGLAVAGTVMLLLNGSAVMEANLLKRFVTYRKAESGAVQHGLEAYPLNAGDVLLLAIFTLFFFGGLAGLLWWRLVWSTELGQTVQVLSVAQVVLALFLFGIHFFFKSGYREQDVAKWETLQARANELQVLHDSYLMVEEDAVRETLKQEFIEDQEDLVNDLLVGVDEFTERAQEYVKLQQEAAAMRTDALTGYETMCQALHAEVAEMLGDAPKYSAEAMAQIREAFGPKIAALPKDEEFDGKLAAFETDVALEFGDDADFEKIWGQAKDKREESAVIDALDLGLNFNL